MMKLSFLSLAIILMLSTAFSQNQLSLEQAVKLALQKNTSLISAQNELNKSEAGVTSAFGNFLPSISAYGSWDWNRSENAARTTNVNGAILDVPASTSETRTYGIGANASIVLFDGLSNYATLSRSKNNLEAMQLSIERKKQEVVFQTIKLYYSVIEANQLLKVREEDVKQQKKNLETIEERNRLGSVTMADVYQQQVQYGNAELQMIQQKNNLETAKSNLLYYLGLDVLSDYSYSDALSQEEMKILSSQIDTDYNKLNELVTNALESRKDYKAQKLTLNSYYNNLSIARSGYLPRLTGTLAYGSYANTFDNLFKSNNYSAGLTLSLPIFNGFSTQYQAEIASVDVMNYELQLNDTERLIKQNLQKTFLDLEAAKKGLLVSERNVKAAEENLKIEQEKYNLGAGKLLDVLIANTSFQNAKTNYINAQFYYIKLSEELKYNLGVLDYSKYE